MRSANAARVLLGTRVCEWIAQNVTMKGKGRLQTSWLPSNVDRYCR